MSKTLITYAQNREDMILYVLLHDVKNGFYVDVGSNDPVIDSVTKFFYDRGWRGINIEPIPSIYKSVSANRKKDINLNVGVSNKSGHLELREYGNGRHGWSTLSEDVKHDHGQSNEYKDYQVEVKKLKDIFKEQKVTSIDFLKIDVEGHEYEVISSNDWKVYRPKIVVVEDTNPEKWADMLISKGYIQIYHDGLNRYFVRDDLEKIHKMSDYVKVLLDGAKIITASQEALERQFKITQDSLYVSQSDLAESRLKVDELNQRIEQILHNPAKFLGIKVLTSALIKRLIAKLKF